MAYLQQDVAQVLLALREAVCRNLVFGRGHARGVSMHHDQYWLDVTGLVAGS